MDVLAMANKNLIDIEKEDIFDLFKFFKKVPNYFNMALGLVKLYLLPAIETKYIWTEQI